MKKILSVLLTLCVMLLALLAVSGAASATDDGVFIVADGVTFAVQTGDTFTYDYYLNVSEKIHSLEARTVYDAAGLELLSDIDEEDTFPCLGSSVLANEEPLGTILYNFSNAKKGKDFSAEDSLLIHAQFRVTAATGTFAIDTAVENLAGFNEHVLIYGFEVAEGEEVGGLCSALMDEEGKAIEPCASDETTVPPTSDSTANPTESGQDSTTEPSTSGTTEPTTPGTTEPEPFTDGYLLGDVDGNGRVDIFDASAIQKSLAGTSGYPSYGALDHTDPLFRVADIDGNERVDIFDASLIQKWLAGASSAQNCGIGESI